MDYKQKVFYKADKVIPHLKEFKKEVLARSYDVQLEQKYKDGINHREPTSKSLEWILNECQEEDNVIITEIPKNFPSETDKFQVVFFSNWYFAWCDMLPETITYFVNKYKLEKR